MTFDFCMFVHFMPFIVYVCTALLPLGVIKNNNNNNNNNNNITGAWPNCQTSGSERRRRKGICIRWGPSH